MSLRLRTHFDAAGSVVKSLIALGAGAAVGTGAGVEDGTGTGFGAGETVGTAVAEAVAVGVGVATAPHAAPSGLVEIISVRELLPP